MATAPDDLRSNVENELRGHIRKAADLQEELALIDAIERHDLDDWVETVKRQYQAGELNGEILTEERIAQFRNGQRSE